MQEDLFKSPERPSMVQCKHGFHHSSAPHSCDWCEDDQCLYEVQQDIAAYREAKVSDDGQRVSLSELRAEFDS